MNTSKGMRAVVMKRTFLTFSNEVASSLLDILNFSSIVTAWMMNSSTVLFFFLILVLLCKSDFCFDMFGLEISSIVGDGENECIPQSSFPEQITLEIFGFYHLVVCLGDASAFGTVIALPYILSELLGIRNPQ